MIYFIYSIPVIKILKSLHKIYIFTAFKIKFEIGTGFILKTVFTNN